MTVQLTNKVTEVEGCNLEDETEVCNLYNEHGGSFSIPTEEQYVDVPFYA